MASKLKELHEENWANTREVHALQEKQKGLEREVSNVKEQIKEALEKGHRISEAHSEEKRRITQAALDAEMRM